MAAPLIGWTFDKLWYGPKPSDVSAMPQRNALLGELRRARLGAIIVALQDDKNAVTALWGQIDDLLAHWERWIVPQYRAAGPGAALPRAAPGQKRKRG
jgi:hypothetical protein